MGCVPAVFNHCTSPSSPISQSPSGRERAPSSKCLSRSSNSIILVPPNFLHVFNHISHPPLSISPLVPSRAAPTPSTYSPTREVENFQPFDRSQSLEVGLHYVGFGVGQITLYPVLIRKGSTVFALYGLGNINSQIECFRPHMLRNGYVPKPKSAIKFLFGSICWYFVRIALGFCCLIPTLFHKVVEYIPDAIAASDCMLVIWDVSQVLAYKISLCVVCWDLLQ
ncbi:uncharacterized protein LOC127260356 [Andrographis paniculata]|uniref:uncharacterized protein LOC127260356 n=1 Tax=Andrographis paniculata TaxID=175694 RepID=UPI0021E7539E|nr:uncharacterized protein LOC127260356 [Andrographis paniculata]